MSIRPSFVTPLQAGIEKHPRHDDAEDVLSISGKKWIFAPVDERKVRYFAQTYGLSDAVSQILANRVESVEAADIFLNPSLKSQLPDPALLPDMDLAVARVIKALESQEKIAIWGDYDVDGATSSALLVRFFKALGNTVQVYIPDRFREGYGPNTQGFQELQEKGIDLIITVDCGTTAFSALNWAQKHGLEVIVIDHHAVESHQPPCAALINPKRLDAVYDMPVFESLAAVGLSFLFVVALNRALREHGFFNTEHPMPELLELLDLVALGTVCDVMPLTGLNRVFVAQGLKVMAQRRNLGLKMLGEVASLKEFPTASHLGFLLGPRINAGGRVGEASLGVQLLTSEDPQEAQRLAQHLDLLNQERQKIEADLEAQALVQADTQQEAPVIMVASEGWHAGVIGIVAGRLKDKFHRPTFVITFDQGMGKGSARSIPGLDVGALIHQACHLGLIQEGGGHAMAGGFSLHPDQLPGFRHFLVEAGAAFFQKQKALPLIKIEGALTLKALISAYIQEFDCLAPYGMGNPQPRFLFQDLRITAVMAVGTQHARVTLAQMDGVALSVMVFRCVGTPLGDFFFAYPKGLVDVVGTISLDSWGGRLKPQLIVEDVRSHTSVITRPQGSQQSRRNE